MNTQALRNNPKFNRHLRLLRRRGGIMEMFRPMWPTIKALRDDLHSREYVADECNTKDAFRNYPMITAQHIVWLERYDRELQADVVIDLSTLYAYF